jgi:hypothetical protein
MIYKRLLILASFILSLCACKESSDTRQLKEIGNSLENSNLFIQENCERIYHSLDQKLREPETSQLAGAWAPPANRVQQLSSAIKKYIDLLKLESETRPHLAEDKKIELFRKLLEYRDNLPAAFDSIQSANDYIKRDISGMFEGIPLLRRYSSPKREEEQLADGKKWADTVFGGSNPFLTRILLNKIKNDILISENQLIRYCDKHAVSNLDGYSVPQATAYLSKCCAKNGEMIEVNAGVSLYSIAPQATISIDGKKVNTNHQSVVRLEIKAHGGIGRHLVPVRIEYYRPDGSLSYFERSLEYYVTE